MATKKNKNTLIYVLAGVTLLLIVLAIVLAKNKPKGEAVSFETVEKRSIRESVTASGKIFPVTEIKISSDVSGEIVELFVEEGDSVRNGQVLARIDPDAYQSQVERGNAALNSAKAQLANSRSQVDNMKAQKDQINAQLINAREIHRRNEDLRKEKVISAQEFDASQTNLRSLEANLRAAEAGIRAAEQSAEAAAYSVKSAEATLRELQTGLRRTTVYAPADGIVSLLNVEKGERVLGTIQMTGTEMMRIANLNSMEVRVEVSENDVPRVSLGDPVDIEVDAYLDRTFKGTVRQIANSASNLTGVTGAMSLTTDQVTNFVVTIDITPSSYADIISPKKPFPFRPGMSASVEITTNVLNDVVSVPIQAVTTREIEEEEEEEEKNKEDAEPKEASRTSTRLEGGIGDDGVREVVFLFGDDGNAKMVEVKTGIQDDMYIQILEGLTVGQKVITGPYAAVSRKLKDGLIVIEEEEKNDEKAK